MTLIESLRARTRRQHEALHSHPLLKGLSDDSLTLEGFHDILLAFDAAYAFHEPDLSRIFPDSPNAPVREWLARDLQRHGLTSVAGVLALETPDMRTPSRLMGYLYVKQGSTLGGHVISRHLQTHLGLRPHVDQHVFAGYGVATGLQWRRFMTALDRYGEDLDSNEVTQGATDTFDHIAHACDAVLDLRATPFPPAAAELRVAHGV